MKASQTEKMRRIKELSSLMAKGVPWSEVLQYGADNWGLKRRQIDEYAAIVRNSWARHYKRSEKYWAEEAVAYRERLAAEAEKAGDLRTAASIRNDIDKIRGLFVDRVRQEVEVKASPIAEAIAEARRNQD